MQVVAIASDQSAPGSIARLTHEYSLRDSLDSAWAAKPLALTHEGGGTRLVRSDPGGVLLSELLDQPWQTGAFLRASIGICVALGHAHAQGLVHKDIKPDHVLVEPATGGAWLTGFGIASRLVRERQAPDLPEAIAGTLAYMAPEQTGRMNRSVDTRSDLYALGVTFYRMVTGILPFTASDPMELVHCHIARQPVPPAERVPGLPAAISAIVVKLLAKTAEERYQTAAGVASDLKRCLAQWEAHGRIEDFALGEDDRPDRLLIPEKLYGREREVEALLASFQRVSQGGRPELVLVSGYSGIGKTSLVSELQKALVPPRGLFAAGKFDQYKRDIPYSTLAQALQTLVRGLLAKNDADLGAWRDALRAALGLNGRLVTDLVPELTLIIGEQPEVAELPSHDAQSRFQLVFRRLVGVFAQPEHPLVVFLDDLQWLDAATLDLMEDLLTHPHLKHLMLVGAYRDNEVGTAHPLARKIQAMRQGGALLRDVVLAPMTREDLGRLIRDSLQCGPGHADPLAELVHEKTNGNPFFAIQFIYSLFDEGMLVFDHVEGHWSWDLDRIHARKYADNVVELMVRKLTRLDPATQSALKDLACLGYNVEFTVACLVYEDSIEGVHARLAGAVRAGLIQQSGASYHFLHDRVQEAAYSLIPLDSREEAHLRIGMLLASRTPPEEIEERIFEIVNQLNRGSRLISSMRQRELVAGLNVIAGSRAKASTAYASALKYLHVGRALLTDEGWRDNYALLFSIERLLAECQLLSADLGGAEERLGMLAERARGAHDIALVTRLRLTLYAAVDRSRGLAVFFEYWKSLGADWSSHTSEEDAPHEYDRVLALLGERQVEELIDSPRMVSQDALDIMDVFSEMVTPALSLVIIRMVRLSLEHGNCDASCFAYVWFGMLAGHRFGDYETGFRFGRLGLDLVERRGLRRYQARTTLCYGALIAPWTAHIKTAREMIHRCFDDAQRVGDFLFTAYSCNTLYTIMLASGDALADVQREAEAGLGFGTHVRFGLVVDSITGQLALVRTLRGLTSKLGEFGDECFDELAFERHLSSDSAMAMAEGWYWIRKAQARFFSGDYPSALEASSKAERLLWTSPGFFEQAEYHFFSALTRAASMESATAEVRQRHLEALKAHHKQLGVWMQHCPENFRDRAALVGAELARVEGRDFDAQRLYEEAIRSAQENNFIQNEALANELAARFYLQRAFDEIGTFYLRRARRCYFQWGADGKVRQLDEAHPALRVEEHVTHSTSTISASVEGLDLSTVVKVSQALSGEIVLEKMLDTLMRLVIAHAGAVRGLLMLARPGEPRVAAEVTTAGSSVDVELRNHPIVAGSIPESVYHHVLRTRESVILDDAANQGAFTSDPYVHQHRSRSILCLPVLKQAVLIGVLYLENPLAACAFTPARVAILDLIASQAAIALENARLYADLQKAQRLEAMGALAGGIAHDFNNILGAILGYGEMALRGAKAQSQLRRDVTAIMAAGERGRALVDRVLAFSRSSVVERIAVHVEGVVREALDLLAAQLADSIRIDACLDAGEAALLGDATQVHQVVMNLGTNAARAMPNGGVLSVTLNVERFETERAATIGKLDKGEYIVLRVGDSGHGIPADVFDLIFDPFFTTGQAGSGTGLGLSLVHGIVTQLGGAIDVASVSGQGSTFTVYLPRAGDAADAEDSAQPLLPSGLGQHVLVVDDEESLAGLAVRTLQEIGYVSTRFTSSTAALAAIREDPTRFDAMITDERMPELSGCALIREVRSLGHGMPILLMSGYVGGGLRERAREAGADDVLKKPLSAHDLATGLARILQD